MKLNYISICLTFLLSFKLSKNEPISMEHYSSKVKVCTSEECRRTAEMLRENIAPWIDPCDDFYSFVCGNFVNNENLEVLRFRRTRELNDKILNILNSDNDFNIQAIAKIQEIFRLCKDEDAIHKFGDNVIQLQLNNVGLPSMPPFHLQTYIPDNFSWILAKLHRNAGIPFLFSLDVDKDLKDFRINRIFIQLDFSTITYISGITKNNKKRDKYFKKYMMGVVKYLYQIEDMNTSDEVLELVSDQVDKVVHFLLSAYEVLEEYIYHRPNYEYITIQKLQEKTDKILRNSNVKFDWQEYLLQLLENMTDNVEDFFGSEESVIVKDMKYLESIFEVISRIDAEVFKTSLWWVTVNDVTHIAYKKLRKLYKKFDKKIFGFITSRENICLSFAKGKYSHALTHVLLQEENLKSAIYKIREINENLKESFIEIIEKASWMDESTREEAKRKLYYMKTYISHESWLEKPRKIENKYAGVTVEYWWYETRLKENVRVVEEKLKLLFVTNKQNKGKFPIDPLLVANDYSYTENIAGVPFGILGMPFFKYGLDSMNYGSIGISLGYLITMAFDEIGRKIDSRGIERNWWNESTLQEFNERTKCFVDFYSKFNINDWEIEMDAKRTLNSNISDNVAMKLTLSAYEKYENNYSDNEKLIDFQHYSSKQLLTLAVASTLCSKQPPHEIYKKYIHSIEHLRINGMFMNSKEMSDIWGCLEESPMNPTNKCYIF